MRITAKQARKNIPTSNAKVINELDNIDINIRKTSNYGYNWMDYNFGCVGDKDEVNQIVINLEKRGFKVKNTYPRDSIHNDLTISW